MSKKLINEAQFRHFAKLAQIDSALTEKKFSEFYSDDGEEASLSEEAPPEQEDLEEVLEDEEEALDEPVPEEEPAVDMPVDELPDEGGADDLGGVEGNEALLARVVQAVADELGVEADVVGAEGAPEEAEVDLDSVEPGLEDEMPPEEAPMGLEDEEELPPGGGRMYENQDDLIEAVAKRVALRLQKKTSTEDVATQIAEKIMKRLS